MDATETTNNFHHRPHWGGATLELQDMHQPEYPMPDNVVTEQNYAQHPHREQHDRRGPLQLRPTGPRNLGHFVLNFDQEFRKLRKIDHSEHDPKADRTENHCQTVTDRRGRFSEQRLIHRPAQQTHRQGTCPGDQLPRQPSLVLLV